MKHEDSKIYFHICSDDRPTAPVVVYAGLRALSYGAITTRRKLEQTHAIFSWHERAILGIESALALWAKRKGVNVNGGKFSDQLHEESRTARLQLLAGRNVESVLDEAGVREV